jgi:hypothetical protein
VDTVVIAVLALSLGASIAGVVACWWNRLRRAELQRRMSLQDQRVVFLEAMLWREPAGQWQWIGLPRRGDTTAVVKRRKPRSRFRERGFLNVGVAGFEPTTSSTRTRHATKLRHTPRYCLMGRKRV